MMRFCTRKGDRVSRWYDYPRTVEDFIDMHGVYLQKDCVWCFVDDEHVWIFDNDGLYERPDLPDWVPDELYPEYDAE